MVMVWEALAEGDTLSVTRKVTKFVVETCATVGVQEKTPVTELMLAPPGAPASRV